MTLKEQTITLNNLRFYAYHGVEAQESVVGAWYSVSVKMETDFKEAVCSDSIADTINYAKVASLIKKQMEIRSQLIEHLAGRIANLMLETFKSLQEVTVSISKENPPLGVPCEAAMVTITAVR